MTTTNHLVYGWEIEGLGTYAESDASFGHFLRLSTETLYEVAVNRLYVRGLADLPSKISTTCEVLKGSTTQSTMQILIDRLDLADQTQSRYSRAALSFFWGARPKPVARLQTSWTAASTSEVVDIIAGETVPAAGDIIYINREAIALTNVTGSGATRTLTMVRGQFGTDAEPHDLEDPDIFLSNPVKLDRRVTLYEYNVRTDTETVRWRGVVEGIDLSDETQVLCVTCRDLLGTISKRRVARERWEGEVSISKPIPATGGEGLSISIRPLTRDDTKVVDYKPFYPRIDAGFLNGTDQYTTLGFDIDAIALEIDGNAIATQVSAPFVPAAGFANKYCHWDGLGGACRQIDGQNIDIDASSKTMKAAEILVCDKDSPLCYFKDDAANPVDHPAYIILNILTSTGTATWTGGVHDVGDNGDYDWLPGSWGLGIPYTWIDQDAFVLLATQWPTSNLRARSGYIGGGGDNGSAWDLLSDLAQAMNCYLYMDDQARISIRRLADPGAGNTDHTLDEGDIAWAENEGDEQGMTEQKPIYAISLECCQRGPGGDPAQIVDAGIIGQKWLGRYRFHAVRDKLDSTRIYGDPVDHRLGRDVMTLATVFKWRYAYAVDRLPQYRIRLVHGSDLVMPGQWITLSHPYIFDNETLTRGITAHRCLVLEGDWDIATGAQELVIVDFQPVTGASTLLSPSWQVSAVSSATSFTISAIRFSETADRDSFVTGSTYKLHLWTADGQLRSTVASAYASAFNSGTGVVTLFAAFSNGASVTPAAGDVVRLADYDNATGWQTLDYTWLGDSAMLLGAANDNAGRWDV